MKDRDQCLTIQYNGPFIRSAGKDSAVVIEKETMEYKRHITKDIL